jgi:hypothetical protein
VFEEDIDAQAFSVLELSGVAHIEEMPGHLFVHERLFSGCQRIEINGFEYVRWQREPDQAGCYSANGLLSVLPGIR